MISTRELTAIRAEMARTMMPDTAAIRGSTGTYSSLGATRTPFTRQTVGCRFATLSGRELTRAQQIAAEADCVVTLPADTLIYTDDTIIVTKAENSTQYTLQVLDINKRSTELARRVLCKELMPQPGSAQTFSGLVDRAAYAAAQGWRRLGVLPSLGWHFHESDIIYNAQDGYYYLFNTEGDGNPPGWTIANVASWVATGASATITLSSPHGIPANGKTLGVVDFTGLVASSGTVGNLNTQDMLCTATTAFTLTVVANSGGFPINVTGSGGAFGTAIPKVNTQVGVHRVTGANALTDLTDTLDANYVSRVATGLYYPTVVYVPGTPNPTWYLFGIDTSQLVRRLIYTAGPWPSTIKAFVTLTTVSTMSGFDLNIRPNPADGMYYCVCTDFNNNAQPKVYRTSSLATDAWTLLTTNIWADIVLPSWATYTSYDASIAFVDGRAYYLFTGGDGATSSLGIAELSTTTFKALAAPTLLTTDAQQPSWTNGRRLTDMVFARCPDGLDRIFAFTNSLANGQGGYDGTGQGVWACLDLPRP